MSFIKKNLLFCIIASLFSANLTLSTSNVYHQILPLLTKKINLAEPTEKQKILLSATNAFLEYGNNNSFIDSEIIKAIDSVNFFSDILPEHLETNTASGAIQAALITSQMTDDIKILQHRQSIIRYFNENPQLLKELDDSFRASASGEEKLLNSFSFSKTQLELINGMKVSAQEKLYFTSENFKSLNNKYILDPLKRIKTSNLLMIPPIVLILAEFKILSPNLFDSILKNCTTKNMKKLASIMVENPMASLGALSSLGASFALNYILVKPDIKQDFDLIYDQQKQLIDIAKLINQMKKICSIISADPEIQRLLHKEIKTLNELFNTSSITVSDNLKHVISELQSSSFEGDPSYYLSLQGKILATHYYLNECKKEMIPYLEAFGAIDAYVSVAKIFENFKHHPRVTFCLPEYVENPTPVLDITNYWHPLINPNTVVTNSLCMGTGNIKNLMITGPNAGGKTTSLMSLIINIIFAQSFGIAPSEKLVITPFAKIHSYLDITTDLQAGLSLFAAEVDRAKKLKQSILSCTGNQKTFTIIDEIFSGTAPDVASDVGSKFATQLGDITHSMAIITTHFPELTKVGQETGTFTNYKVADATIMPNGKVVYPFKLVPGVSSQNIAQHMLKQEDVI